jgi:protein-S-isoprenylcysteine O-methyltransferase Ste14
MERAALIDAGRNLGAAPMNPNPESYHYALAILWIGWLVSWWLAARSATPAKARAAQPDERRYHAYVWAGSILIFVSYTVGRHFAVLYPPSPAVGWTMIAVQAAGLAFAWWARIHLGRLWSATVTRKEDHRVIESGPYALVRHPIYTGIIVALFATAAIKGSVLSFAGFALLVVSFIMKARLEERFLGEELGPEYDAYAERVPMLVPFWPKGRLEP